MPLVKDTYASERRKAKTLNFSIAYGKVQYMHNPFLDLKTFQDDHTGVGDDMLMLW